MLSHAALVYDQGQDWVVEIGPGVTNVEVGDHVSCGIEHDELVTKTYDLDDINEGYRAMRDGENIRGVLTYG